MTGLRQAADWQDFVEEFAQAAAIPAASVTAEARLVSDLGLDSLKVVELTMLLEKLLGRPVFLPEWIASVEDPAELTVASLARFLADKR